MAGMDRQVDFSDAGSQNFCNLPDGRPEAFALGSQQMYTVVREQAMTVTLNLKPELEVGLFAQARASGMTVEEYLLSVVEGAVLTTMQKTLSSEELAAAFEAWSAGHRPTPPLSDYAVSRDGMYEGRDH